VLSALLGEENIVSTTLKSLATEFGRWPLIDKKLAVMPDARLGPKADAHALAEHLLSISGGDRQTINRKMQSYWSGYLRVRFLMATNELPAIADASGTLASRFILLKLTESFYGREDLGLKEKLLAELPGILNWALDGLQRLTERGHFQLPASSLASIQQLEDLASPTSAFLREFCEVGDEREENVKVLYGAYEAWAKGAGYKPVPSHVFGKNLHALLPTLRTKGVGRDRMYVGAGLSSYGKHRYDVALKIGTIE
jgi:putative DNA primase/helicase